MVISGDIEEIIRKLLAATAYSLVQVEVGFCVIANWTRESPGKAGHGPYSV